jgi:hypothetical protein
MMDTVGFLEAEISVTSNKLLHCAFWHAKAVDVGSLWNAQDAAETVFYCLHRQRISRSTFEMDVKIVARIKRAEI